MVEGKIPMAARRHVTNKLRTAYAGASKRDMGRQLIDHTNYILKNHFRDELGLAPGPIGDGSWRVGASSVNPAATFEIDGEDMPAFEIDTDPFVYALGAQIRPDVVKTLVIARDHLPYIRLALHTRTPTTA